MSEPGSNAEVITESESPLSQADEDAKLIAGMKEKGLTQEKPDPEEDLPVEKFKGPPKEPKPSEKPRPKAEVGAEGEQSEEAEKEPPKKLTPDLIHQARERGRMEREQKQKERDLEDEVERRVQARLSRQQRQEPQRSDPDLRRMAIQDPMAFYRSLGADPNDIMTIIAAHELGKEVPAHLRPLQHQMSLKSQTDETIAQLQREVARLGQAQQEHYQRQEIDRARSEVRGDIKSFLTGVPEQYTLVKKQYERNPSRALEKIWDLTEQYARQYPDDAILSPEEAAAYYEAALQEELGPWLEELKAKTPVAPPPPEKPEPKRQVSPSDVAGRSSAKDELPWDDDDKVNDILTGRLKRGAHLPSR